MGTDSTYIPELQSVSMSSEDPHDSDSEWGSGDCHWDEDDWDTEDEEGINEHYREMMKVGMGHPDFLNPSVTIPEFDKYAEERKDNPFLKLLGSLRGINSFLWIPMYSHIGCRTDVFLGCSLDNHRQDNAKETNYW